MRPREDARSGARTLSVARSVLSISIVRGADFGALGGGVGRRERLDDAMGSDERERSGLATPSEAPSAAANSRTSSKRSCGNFESARMIARLTSSANPTSGFGSLDTIDATSNIGVVVGQGSDCVRSSKAVTASAN